METPLPPTPQQLAQVIERITNFLSKEYAGIVYADTDASFADDITDLLTAAKRTHSVEQSAGFCDKHQPTGGARNCLVCAVEKLSHALSKISYACGRPNEMQVSDYDVHFNEDAVVKQVEKLVKRTQEVERKLEAEKAQYRLTKGLLNHVTESHDLVKQQLYELAKAIRNYTINPDSSASYQELKSQLDKVKGIV